MLAIEKNIPIPAAKHGRKVKYPFPFMRVGDSFLVRTHERPKYYQAVLPNCARRFKVRIVMRNIANGTRVWRVK